MEANRGLVAVGETASVLKAGSICLDFEARRVTIGGRFLALTFQEFELLAVLLGQPGQVVSYRYICQVLWGSYGRAESKRLSVIVSRLRQKLPEPEAFRLEAVAKRGYSVAGLVRSSGT